MINKFIVGIGSREREYTVNNVRYTVSSKFLPPRKEKPFRKESSGAWSAISHICKLSKKAVQ